MNYWKSEEVSLLCGDAIEAMRGFGDCHFDCVFCDPPYGLAFMGKDWDHGVPGVPYWQDALRVCKPGAMLLAFGGTRTHHRLMVAIEDAGWEIRDCMMWLYGSGFPKSLDISKAIDRAAGAERRAVGHNRITGLSPGRENFGADDRSGGKGMGFRPGIVPITAPATCAAKQLERPRHRSQASMGTRHRCDEAAGRDVRGECAEVGRGGGQCGWVQNTHLR